MIGKYIRLLYEKHLSMSFKGYNWPNNLMITISTSLRLFGWVICSQRSPDADKVILGATLEIQRLQREEILEQQLMRQQVKLFETHFIHFFYFC